MSAPQWYRGEMKFLVMTHWICPKPLCMGQMISDGEMVMTRTPGYSHVCNKCNYAVILRVERYPRLERDQKTKGGPFDDIETKCGI